LRTLFGGGATAGAAVTYIIIARKNDLWLPVMLRPKKHPTPEPIKITDTHRTVTEPPAPPPGNVPRRHKTMVDHGETQSPLWLDATDGPLKGTQITVSGSVFRIGADRDNELPIDSDKYVSGKHAIIQASREGWVLADRNSTNGTTINGQKAVGGQNYPLRDGMQIRIGGSEFRVVMGSRAKAAGANPNSQESRANAASQDPLI
jgi:pSer/pThr/pTyr-binding forkhead associated (FHA) protein